MRLFTDISEERTLHHRTEKGSLQNRTNCTEREGRECIRIRQHINHNMSWIRDQDHLSRVLEEELKCPVCLEEFVEPKCLSCSHTVCLQCLRNMAQNDVDYVRCPTCRYETDIRFPGGIDLLPTNYIATSLITGKERTRDIKELEKHMNRSKRALEVRQELLIEMTSMTECLGNRRQQVEGEIRQTAERIIQMVRESEEKLIQQLNLRVADKQRELRQRRVVMQSLIADANDTYQRVEQQINSLPTRRLVEEKTSLLAQLRDIDLIEMTSQIPEVGDIRFTPAISMAESEQLAALGKLVIGSGSSVDVRQTVPDYNNSNVEISPFGTAGNGDGEFVLPWGVAIRQDGCIAVADHANCRIQVFDNQGIHVQTVPSNGSERIKLPTSIDFDLDHNLITFDGESRELKVLDGQGQLIRSIGSGEELGDRVEGISVDCEGRIIVTDTLKERVLVFHHSGQLCLEFGSTGKNRLGRPSYAVFDHGRFIVSDTFDHCLKVFNRYGVFLQQIGRPGKEAGQFRQPRGLAVDSAGNILVCDAGNCRIQVLDFHGNFVRSFGGVGGEVGNFCLPYCLAVGNQGELVVSDCNNNRVQIIRFPLREANSE